MKRESAAASQSREAPCSHQEAISKNDSKRESQTLEWTKVCSLASALSVVYRDVLYDSRDLGYNITAAPREEEEEEESVDHDDGIRVL